MNWLICGAYLSLYMCGHPSYTVKQSYTFIIFPFVSTNEKWSFPVCSYFNTSKKMDPSHLDKYLHEVMDHLYVMQSSRCSYTFTTVWRQKKESTHTCGFAVTREYTHIVYGMKSLLFFLNVFRWLRCHRCKEHILHTNAHTHT